MAVKSIKVGKTTNIGNFQNEYLEITYDLEVGDTVTTAVAKCRKVIAAQYKPTDNKVKENGNGKQN